MAFDAARVDRYGELEVGVGNTPTRWLPLPNEGRLLCKEEWRNPSGSHYDRVYPALLRQLEERGSITPGETELVDATSGNAGAALARCTQILGYACTVIIPGDMPSARLRQLEGYGARVICSPPGRYIAGAVKTLQRYLVECRHAQRSAYCLDHSRRPEALTALRSLGRELLHDLGDAQPDYFVGVIGNGLTIRAVQAELRPAFRALKTIGVEPVEASVTYAKKYPDKALATPEGRPGGHAHGLLGAGGWGVAFPYIDPQDYDGVALVTPEDWKRGQEALDCAGLEVGRTSGACYSVAQRLAATRHAAVALQLLYDPAWKYDAG